MRSTALVVALMAVASIATAQSPSPRSSAGLVLDPSDGTMLLFGGYGVQGAPPDELSVVWRSLSSGWTPVMTQGNIGPGVRADMVVAFDSSSRRLLLIGGQTRDSAYGDVWQWRDQRWSRVTDGGPGGRHLVAGAWDPIRHTLLLTGGHDLNANVMRHDTWALDANGWRLADSSRVLGQRFAAGMAWDPARRAIVLHGGHTVDGGVQTDSWEWKGNAWQRIATNGPSIPAHNALVADPLGRGILLISSPGDPVRDPMETWLLEGSRWRRLAVGGPSPRGGHALVHDAAARRVYLFGGEADPRTKFNDVWQFDGERWSRGR